MDRIGGGLKDIFSTILKETGDSGKALPQIIVLSGNGHVIAPGGTVHVVQHGTPPEQPDLDSLR